MSCNRILFLSVGFVLFFLIGCNNRSDNSEFVPDYLRKKAVKQLRENLQKQSKWGKVHAAEYLLWLGYPAEVKEVFNAEQQRYGNEPPYRIGIWRVLAQAATEPEKKAHWIEKILEAYKDSNGKDRLHAVETLAKLKVPILKTSRETTRRILSDKNSPLYVYTLWAASYTSPDSIGSSYKTLLDLTLSDGVDKELTRQSAYALRRLNSLNDSEWHALAKRALAEPNKSEARIYLLSAAFTTTPKDSVFSNKYLNVKKCLLKAKNSQNVADRMELLSVLAEQGTQEDLPTLLSLLTSKDPDIKATVAYAILRIDQRKE